MRAAFLWAWLAVAFSGCSWTRVPLDDPRIQYTGRVDHGDPAGPRFSNTGTSVAVRVGAPAVRFHLRDVPYARKDGTRHTNRYELLIDGAPAGVLAAETPEWWQTVELEPGEHVVELFKRTEAAVGQGQLLSIEIPFGGHVSAPPERPARRIEIIGDSLTTGFGDLGAGPQCPFSSITEDGYRAYGSLAGRLLHAEMHIVAWEGRGVVRNYDLDAVDTIPQLYERTLPEDPASRWDFSKWTPQVVVIQAGANDFGQTGLDIPAFEQGYFDLVKEVRRRYPQALILCGAVGVTDDWPQGAHYGTLSRQAMERIMQRLAAAGLTKVKTFEFAPPSPLDGLGCLWHATLPSHQARAQRLRDVISQAMGWR
ncbi:MAG TPA: GDSL-type esterase/lipase family protein [Myxococcaceae bacterium]|nr:GDSL-type esterase/lipase family protein [Myxococcaceae bacterium]